MRYLITFLALSACTTLPQNDLVVASSKYLGLHEVADRQELSRLVGVDPVRTEWCAAFVNTILEQQGYPTTNSLLARSFTDYGEPVFGDPEPGDIVVLRRGTEGWQGHVGIYLDTKVRNGKTYYVLISGNDDDSVRIGQFNANRLITIRRPI